MLVGGYALGTPMEPMHLLFMVTLFPLIASGVVVAVFWGVVSVRIAQTSRRLPTGMDGVDIAEREGLADCPVLVVIPAHNEAGSIGALIRSLREQDHQRFHVVLALDRCTDGTAAVAKRETAGDTRFEVVEIEHCPEGWAGKVHAVHEGLSRTRYLPEAEQLLFTDADCVLHPACLRATSALARDRGLDLLSLLSEYPAVNWYEHVAQPIAGFELIRQYPLLRANRDDDRQRPFANGQFMMFNARFYREMGGHEAVKGELLEDLAFARAVKQQGGRGGAFLGGGVVRCRMYETWDEFKKGWRRILIEAAQRRSDRLRSNGWRLRLLGAILPGLTLVLGIVSTAACAASDEPAGWCVLPAGLGLAGVGAYVLAVMRIYGIARVSRLAPLLAPAGVWLVSGLMLEAARDLRTGEPTVWGGKAYHREDRSAGRPGAEGVSESGERAGAA